MLREQDVIRNELLSRYEKRNEDMTKEVSKASLSVLWRCSELWCVCECAVGLLQGAERCSDKEAR